MNYQFFLLSSSNFFNYRQLNVSLKKGLNFFFMELIDLCILIFLKKLKLLEIPRKKAKKLNKTSKNLKKKTKLRILENDNADTIQISLIMKRFEEPN